MCPFLHSKNCVNLSSAQLILVCVSPFLHQPINNPVGGHRPSLWMRTHKEIDPLPLRRLVGANYSKHLSVVQINLWKQLAAVVGARAYCDSARIPATISHSSQFICAVSLRADLREPSVTGILYHNMSRLHFILHASIQ
jgi:hypothetical protein